MEESRAREYLGHMLQAMERIESYTADLSEMEFLDSGITQDAVVRHFELWVKRAATSSGTARRLPPRIRSCL